MIQKMMVIRRREKYFRVVVGSGAYAERVCWRRRDRASGHECGMCADGMKK